MFDRSMTGKALGVAGVLLFLNGCKVPHPPAVQPLLEVPAGVTILPQIHFVPGMNRSDPAFPRVLDSQARIARELLRFKDPVVFVEGMDIIADQQFLTKLRTTGGGATPYQAITKAFASGFPSEGTPFTKEQEALLVEQGGAHILFCLGKVKEVRPCIPEQELEAIEKLKNLVAAKHPDIPTEMLRSSTARHIFLSGTDRAFSTNADGFFKARSDIKGAFIAIGYMHLSSLPHQLDKKNIPHHVQPATCVPTDEERELSGEMSRMIEADQHIPAEEFQSRNMKYMKDELGLDFGKR